MIWGIGRGRWYVLSQYRHCLTEPALVLHVAEQLSSLLLAYSLKNKRTALVQAYSYFKNSLICFQLQYILLCSTDFSMTMCQDIIFRAKAIFCSMKQRAISVKCLKLIVSPYSKSSPKKDNFLMPLSHLLEMQKNLFCLHLPEPSSGVSMQFNCNCHLGNDCKDLAECMNHWVGF